MSSQAAPADPSLGYLLHRAARLLRRVADRRLKPLGLTSGYLPVLMALSDGSELSQKALTARAAIEQPSMAEMLGRMERDGLIRRRSDPADKRGSLISLLPAALERVPEIRAAIEGITAEGLQALDGDQGRVLQQNLKTIIASLEAGLEDK